MEFQIGDIVQFRTGSPQMTINTFRKDETTGELNGFIEVVYYEIHENSIKGHIFHHMALTKVVPDSQNQVLETMEV